MSEWKDFRDELLSDPDVKQAYNANTAQRELARAILLQRQADNLTQKDLADKMRVPQGNVSRLESGTRTPAIATLQKAASALNVPFEIRFGNHVIHLNQRRSPS